MSGRSHEILFVCTGNICRSPMAEYLLRRELDGTCGWRTSSAGLAAMANLPASLNAVAVMAEKGIDLSPHRSRQLTRELVDAATVCVVMTGYQKTQIASLWPEAAGKVFLLTSFDVSGVMSDIEDPIGQPAAAYRRVCSRIKTVLPDLVLFLHERWGGISETSE